MAKILIVEDSEALGKLCRAELEDDGYLVELTDNGDEALVRLQAGGIDLVVLDLLIEGASGLRVMRKALRWNPELPIIIYSAHPEFQRHFATWSAAAFVVKSSDLDPLKAEVRRVLATREDVRQRSLEDAISHGVTPMRQS
jgi:DNA-binding NtrC family response regulator